MIDEVTYSIDNPTNCGTYSVYPKRWSIYEYNDYDDEYINNDNYNITFIEGQIIILPIDAVIRFDDYDCYDYVEINGVTYNKVVQKYVNYDENLYTVLPFIYKRMELEDSDNQVKNPYSQIRFDGYYYVMVNESEYLLDENGEREITKYPKEVGFYHAVVTNSIVDDKIANNCNITYEEGQLQEYILEIIPHSSGFYWDIDYINDDNYYDYYYKTYDGNNVTLDTTTSNFNDYDLGTWYLDDYLFVDYYFLANYTNIQKLTGISPLLLQFV